MSSDSLLQFDIQHRAGALSLDVKFELRRPWTVLFGPSGSGKTTILRVIAGFIQPATGRISFGTRVVVDSAAGISIPAHARPVRSAAQNARLFPHMSVLSNLNYGTTSGGTSAHVEALAEHAVERFHLAPFLERSVADLSGGERQRIAIIRAAIAAVSAGPGTILLLDEPFTGLDLPRRDDFARELCDWLRQGKIPVLSVTHDVGETFQLASEVIKIHRGRIVAQGPVDEVLTQERTRLLQQLGKDFPSL